MKTHTQNQKKKSNMNAINSIPRICPLCKQEIAAQKVGYRADALLGGIPPQLFCTYACFREATSAGLKKRVPKYKTEHKA